MQIISHDSTPPIVAFDESGEPIRGALSAENLESTLDGMLRGAPGVLTELITSLSPEERKKRVEKRLLLAVFTADGMQGSEESQVRRPAEVAMLAQIDSYFHFNFDPRISANGFSPTEEQIEQLGIRTVEIYITNDLIKITDTVLDVGSGKGYIAKYLAKKHVNVEAIDPNEYSANPAFPETKKMTIEQYASAYPGKQFSVVHAGNFRPLTKDRWFDVATYQKMIDEMAKLTADGGIALIGISSMDPAFVSGSRYNLRPLLAKAFGHVEYLSARRLGQKFSIGGQMGVFKCSDPRRDAAV